MAADLTSDQAERLTAIVTQLSSQTLPPVQEWHPSRVGEIDIRIARDAVWYHEGAPITRPALVTLFSKILRRDGGQYFLVTPVEQLQIVVDDAPFLAVELEVIGAGVEQQLVFKTNVEEIVIASAEHPVWIEPRANDEIAPYLLVRDRLPALLSRPVYYQLADFAVESEQQPNLYGVWSGGHFFALE